MTSIASRQNVGRPNLALVLGVLLTIAVSAHAFTMAAFQAKVVGVADRDTLTLLRDKTTYRLRLHGIDAPERGQPYGSRAKQYASELAFGKVVTVEPVDRDQNGRLVADVRLPDGRSLNAEMVRAGYAWWFRRYSRDPELAQLEAEARETRRGLWADPHPVPPWEWRQRRGSPTPVSR
jgi:micrococcal nuclease